MQPTRRSLLTATAGLAGIVAATGTARAEASARKLNQDADRALNALYASQPKMRDLGKRAVAILIFPKIIKAGFLLGGQGGDGVLRVGGKPEAYYGIAAGSFGLQAGVQTFSYVLFFMTPGSLDY